MDGVILASAIFGEGEAARRTPVIFAQPCDPERCFLQHAMALGRLIEGLCNLESSLVLTIAAKKSTVRCAVLVLVLGGSGGMQNSVSDSERHCSGTSLDATAPSTRPHVICWILRIWMKNDVEKRWFVPRCYSRHERTEICRFNLPRPCVVLEEGTSAFTKLFS